MPRKNVTAYDLLISCPGDVSKYVDVVRECIESFNITIGRLNSAEIVGQHWSTSSFSQSGDRPQEILNKQFVRDCDAAVAIFGHALEPQRTNMVREQKKKLKKCVWRENRSLHILLRSL